ncbi:MAG: type II toxin-antitoxin system prevent-host-death family antitoxin [Deltaproteobacteria bacterium]|nr:type II toxin-antitoxin system prevent-host-death family antitoxin [Deltaproteobacteria bacterium]
MKEVNIAVLKNSLSAYLRRVRAGGRFLVTDRGEPVAKLVPIGEQGGAEAASLEERLLILEAEALLRRPVKQGAVRRHAKIRGLRSGAAELIAEERETW